EEINKKRKELEQRRQQLLYLNEKFKIKQEEGLPKSSLSTSNDNNNKNDTNPDTREKDSNNGKGGGEGKKEEEEEEEEKEEKGEENTSKEDHQEPGKKETFDYTIFLDSDTVKKKLIRNSYVKSFEYLNNKLMCARQILIEELSNIFKLKKITGLPHSGSHSSNAFNTNSIPPGSNKSSFLNNSFSQVLHDTTSKIFGTFETEVELNNHIYHNPNFSLYEDIFTATPTPTPCKTFAEGITFSSEKFLSV
ncbi:hypothetical protein PIROE2DRAFT_14584, partial [Piromyces sp. E2]